MKEESFDKQNPFAKEKKPSMLRRFAEHDYQERQIYMITMTTEGRRPLLGKVVGKSDAVKGSPEEPRILLSELGLRVERNWHEIALRYPQISIIALQMMPDHFHGILFVTGHLDRPLGKVLLGFKQGCNKAYRECVLGIPPVAPHESSVPPIAPVASSVPYVAVSQQQVPVPHPPAKESRAHGLLFARGYNDKLLLRTGQLENWLHYLDDNPRRLLMKREHPDLFRVQRGLVIGSQTFAAIGNRFLALRPERLQVQCSRSLTQEEIEATVKRYIHAAEKGAVLVSPAISPGEKAVLRAAFDRGFPLIYLQENGFGEMAKPGGKRMEACARGQLLILAPWQHHNERIAISREQCRSLNEMARIICLPSSNAEESHP